MTGRPQQIKLMIRVLFALIVVMAGGGGLVYAQAPMPETCIPAPPNGRDLAWDGQHIWILTDAVGENGIVHQLNPTTGQLLTSFPTPSANPRGLAFDGQHLWVLDSFDPIIYQMDRTTQQVIRQIPAPARFLSGLTWDGSTFWTLNDTSDILQLSPVDGTVLTTHISGKILRKIAWDGLHLWASSGLEVFKTDPSDGEIFESVIGGSTAGLTFNGTTLLSIEITPDEICTLTIDTSPGVSVTIIPPSTKLLQSQAFDTALFIKSPGVTVTRASVSLNGSLVTTFPPDPALPSPFAACLIPGTVSSQPGQTFRCTGLTGERLGVGRHTIETIVEFNDGRNVTDSVIWHVLEITEP